MAARTLLRYIELKSGYADNGPAWVAHVRTSKSGTQIYFNGKALQRGEGSRHFDIETGEIYWVSGIKKNGADRHWAGGGKVSIEKGAVAAYLALVGETALDRARFVVVDDLPRADIARFHVLANTSYLDETFASRCATDAAAEAL